MKDKPVSMHPLLKPGEALKALLDTKHQRKRKS